MCGRYWINSENNPEMDEIITRIPHPENMKTSGEIFPGDHVPVICKSRAGNIRPFAMEWGWRMADGKRLINARSETAAEKTMFREGMALRRCLLPMNAYFEWERHADEKIRRRIAPDGSGLHYLAGIYRFEQEKPVCTVLTMAAADEIAFIHHRMPVILQGAQREAWLAGESLRNLNLPAVSWE